MDCKTAQQMIMPYIEHRLSDRDTGEFIEHIRGCKACGEELEVYFTIYYALEKLDNEDKGAYNFQALLERDLKQRENSVKGHNIVKFYRHLFMALLGILTGVFLITAVQIFLRGSFEETTLYRLFSAESETMRPTEWHRENVSTNAEETIELETNRKRQVIVTTPETEAWTTR